MNQDLDLQNQFLIAMPNMVDLNFNRAVIYVCAYNAEGAMGIVVNQPIIDISLGEVLLQMNIHVKSQQVSGLPVLLGGPVQPERGFIIHRPLNKWQSTLITGSDIGVTSSQDILHAIANDEGPNDSVVILGYAGWAPGQLEQEITNNIWLTTPATPEILFDVPFEERWHAAVSSMGVDLDSLSCQVGHA